MLHHRLSQKTILLTPSLIGSIWYNKWYNIPIDQSVDSCHGIKLNVLTEERQWA